MASTSGTTYTDLAEAFRAARFRPLYFFCGNEGFLIDELQQLLIEHALLPQERDFNLEVVFGPEATSANVLAQCAALPMMAERRVVIVRGFELMDEHSPERKHAFGAYAERPNPAAIVVLICGGKPNLGHRPYNVLRKHAVFAEFKSIYPDKLPAWINQRLKSRGVRAHGGAAQRIAESVEPDLRMAANEVDRLVSFLGEGNTITEDDVIAAAGHLRGISVFELSKAIGTGNYESALGVLNALLSSASDRKSEAVKIVALLSNYFAKLWKLTSCLTDGVRASELPGRLGVPPFAIGEYRRAAQLYSYPFIHRALRVLLAADAELKGASDRDERLVLTLALNRLCIRRAA